MGGSQTPGAIQDFIKGAPLKTIWGLSGSNGPSLESFLTICQCLWTNLLIVKCWWEYPVIKGQVKLPSVLMPFPVFSKRRWSQSSWSTWSSFSLRKWASYPFSKNLSVRTLDWALKSVVVEQFRFILIYWLLGTESSHALWWQLSRGINEFRSVALKWVEVNRTSPSLQILRSIKLTVCWLALNFSIIPLSFLLRPSINEQRDSWVPFQRRTSSMYLAHKTSSGLCWA